MTDTDTWNVRWLQRGFLIAPALCALAFTRAFIGNSVGMFVLMLLPSYAFSLAVGVPIFVKLARLRLPLFLVCVAAGVGAALLPALLTYALTLLGSPAEASSISHPASVLTLSILAIGVFGGIALLPFAVRARAAP